MGQSSAATVKEIEEVRGRLENNMRELERRMPQPAVWAKRAVGVAVGGGVGAFILMKVVKRARKRRKPEGAVMGSRPIQAVVQVVPEQVADRVAEAVERGTWKQWAAAGAGVWLAVRLLELRQLRRMNRALIEGRA